MKRILVFIVVIAMSLAMAGGAMAGPKPPNSICLNWVGTSAVTTMAIKAFGGNLMMSDGATKFYAIHGEHLGTVPFPLTGTGHMKGDVFHFAFTAIAYSGSEMVVADLEGTWNVVTKTGSMQYSALQGSTVFTGASDLDDVPCSGVSLPKDYSPGATNPVTGE